jgi:hypothetical protein
MWCLLSHHISRYLKARARAWELLISDVQRKDRRDAAQRKIYTLALDQTHVLSANQGGEGLDHTDEGIELISRELTEDEFRRLFNTRARLQDDIEILLDALVDNQDNIDALFRVIEAAGLLGRFMGPHPLQRKLSIAPATGKRKSQKQKRLEIVELLLAKAEATYPDAGSYSLAKTLGTR